MHVHVYMSIQELSICTIQIVSLYTPCRYIHSCRYFLYRNTKFMSSQIKGSIFYYIQYSTTDLLGGEQGRELYLFVNFIFKMTKTNTNNIRHCMIRAFTQICQ